MRFGNVESRSAVASPFHSSTIRKNIFPWRSSSRIAVPCALAVKPISMGMCCRQITSLSIGIRYSLPLGLTIAQQNGHLIYSKLIAHNLRRLDLGLALRANEVQASGFSQDRSSFSMAWVSSLLQYLSKKSSTACGSKLLMSPWFPLEVLMTTWPPAAFTRAANGSSFWERTTEVSE